MEILIEERYKDIAKKFFISIEQLKQDSLKSYLLDRKKQLMNERFEILSRYSVINVDELETKIKQGVVVEHPSWEDLIDLRNLEAEIEGIKNDISRL